MSSETILPEVIQIIPAIEAESQGVFLETQSAEKLPHGFWCTLEDRDLRGESRQKFYREQATSFKKTVVENIDLLLSPSCSLYLHA